MADLVLEPMTSETLQDFVEHMSLVEQASHASTAPDYFGDVYRRVVARLEAADFCGADPFDGLNSRLFAKLPFSSLPIARLAWLQLFKKSPYDLRALAKVPPSTNPVTLALAARTYALTGEMRRCAARSSGSFTCAASAGGMARGAIRFPGKPRLFTWRVACPTSLRPPMRCARYPTAALRRRASALSRTLPLSSARNSSAEAQTARAISATCRKPTRWSITPISGVRMCWRSR